MTRTRQAAPNPHTPATSCSRALAGTMCSLAVALTLHCGGENGDDSVVGADANPTEDPDFPCPDPGASFDEENPGIYFLFTITRIELMGQVRDIGTGAFQPAAREEFDKQPEGAELFRF